MLWDFNWFRDKTADALVPRLADHASPGDIIVIHDGHHVDARAGSPLCRGHGGSSDTGTEGARVRVRDDLSDLISRRDARQ